MSVVHCIALHSTASSNGDFSYDSLMENVRFFCATNDDTADRNRILQESNSQHEKSTQQRVIHNGKRSDIGSSVLVVKAEIYT